MEGRQRVKFFDIPKVEIKRQRHVCVADMKEAVRC